MKCHGISKSLQLLCQQSHSGPEFIVQIGGAPQVSAQATNLLSSLNVSGPFRQPFSHVPPKETLFTFMVQFKRPSSLMPSAASCPEPAVPSSSCHLTSLHLISHSAVYRSAWKVHPPALSVIEGSVHLCTCTFKEPVKGWLSADIINCTQICSLLSGMLCRDADRCLVINALERQALPGPTVA